MRFCHNIEITARDNGQVAVERVIAGVIVDRFTTHNFHNSIKRTDRWIRDTQELLSQPSANVVIEVPPVPELELTLEQEHRLRGITIAGMSEQIDALMCEHLKLPAICDNGLMNNGRTVDELMQLANKVAAAGA